MEHREFKRLVPGADTAVLLLHGIVGTPNHFRVLIPLQDAVPAVWSVHNLCLPGHGGTVEDFRKSSMEQWRNHAKSTFLELAESHKRVILVGHSMGTLFSLQLAVEFPEKVAGLFLLAVPMRPHVGLTIINSSLRLVFNAIREDKPMETAIASACGSTPTKLVWKYILWLPRFVELFAEIHRTEKILSKLSVPYVIFQSEKDELVANRSAKVLRKYGLRNIRTLPDSGHFYYAPSDRKRVMTSFRNVMKRDCL